MALVDKFGKTDFNSAALELSGLSKNAAQRKANDHLTWNCLTADLKELRLVWAEVEKIARDHKK